MIVLISSIDIFTGYMLSPLLVGGSLAVGLWAFFRYSLGWL